MITYLIGCVLSYFLTWALFGNSKTLGTALVAFILGCCSWLGVAFLLVTKGVYKLLKSDKEI
jgi:hypothetical protein